MPVIAPHRRLAIAALLSGAALGFPALAAVQQREPTQVATPIPPDEAEDENVIDFAADTLTYDEPNNTVTASGNVVVVRGGYRLSADQVTYERDKNTVTASGNVVILDPDGNEAYSTSVELDDALKNGAVDGFLLVLQDGGRLAASGGVRVDGRSRLDRAVYSPCDVIDGHGCPKEPLWQIKARSIVHDPEAERVRYKGARLELFGIPLLFAPAFSHPDSAETRASGLLQPDLKIDRSTGVSLTQPYLVNLSDSSDLTISPTLYTEVNPSLGIEYRKLTGQGPIKIGAIGTYSQDFEFDEGNEVIMEDDARYYIYGNGRLQHNEHWRSSFGVRVTSDDTFLRRYDISRDDTLRNFYRLERLGTDSYFAVENWVFQGLRRDDDQGVSPIALPVARFAYTPQRPIAGGKVALEASSAFITRTDGMDDYRVSASAEWKRSLYSPLGHRITGRALVRGDVYRVFDPELATFSIYAGEKGWQGRFIPAAAIDVEWPFAGPAFGGTQMLTPRVQISATPTGLNDGIPNEDSRSVDLDTTNLFDISRFPGYDRWEGGARITYGATWRLRRPRWLVETEIGQSYRLNDQPSILPKGTGLEDEFSDFVGRNTLRIGRRFDLTHRYRLDKDNLTLRRNEIDLTIGGYRDFIRVGYLKLDRDIAIEDLVDREEVRAGGRLQLTRFWAIFGSVILDLTDRNEDPLSFSDGFEPIRHRVGIAYDDECFEFSATWRRDYVADRDFERGNSFKFTIAFKHLG